MIRFALIAFVATAPALAQEAQECGACTDLDRAAMSEPVTAPALPAPPRPATPPDRGQAIELAIPGLNTPTVFYKPSAGLWVSNATPGGIFVRPKKDKFSIDMRF